MGIITVDDLSVPEYSGSNSWLEEPPEQPEIAPTKVSDYEAFDENKLDARLNRFFTADERDLILGIVNSWLLNIGNEWRRGGYQSALNTANSLDLIRANQLRNK